MCTNSSTQSILTDCPAGVCESVFSAEMASPVLRGTSCLEALAWKEATLGECS